MPHHQEAPADQVVDLALIRAKVDLLTRDRCRDDGVVVAHLAVIHITACSRAAPPCQRPIAADILSKSQPQSLEP